MEFNGAGNQWKMHSTDKWYTIYTFVFKEQEGSVDTGELKQKARRKYRANECVCVWAWIPFETVLLHFYFTHAWEQYNERKHHIYSWLDTCPSSSCSSTLKVWILQKNFIFSKKNHTHIFIPSLSVLHFQKVPKLHLFVFWWFKYMRCPNMH